MLLRWWKRFLDAFLLWLAMELSWTRGHKVSPSKFYWGDLKFWKIRDLGIWIDETLQHSVNGRVIWCHSLHNFRISQIHPHYRCFLCRSSIEWKYLEIQTWEKPPKQKKNANMISGSSSRLAVFDWSSKWFNRAYVITSNHGRYSNDYELDSSI